MASSREQDPRKPGSSLLDRDGMISKEELAVFLDVAEGTLDQWASRGGGPEFHAIGNHRKYLPADVRAWLASRRREVSSDRKPAKPRPSSPSPAQDARGEAA